MCVSQNETNIWYFGRNAGLDFNSGSPVSLGDGRIDTQEGCASISNSNGNLLFYTDGVTVYNKNHQIMPNVEGLNGDFSSTHSAIIIPKPNSPNIYFIFTADALGGENGLQYSEVDMTLNSDLGGITENKNIPLYPLITEKLTAVKHATLNEYWVVSHKYGTNEFLTYRISGNGVDLDPIISAVGSRVGITSDRLNTTGQIKISPNGKKLALARTNGTEVQLFDFNASTGQITNAITLSSSLFAYGIEFSPNSQLLYVNAGLLYQYDLSSPIPSDIISSELAILNLFSLDNPNTGIGALQLASNGKIYLAQWDSDYLHVINEPNNLGMDCDFTLKSLYLGGRISKLGLPPFIQSFFIVGFQAENICEDIATQFTTNLSQPYDSIIWDFGDGNTSTEENPSHTYLNAGDYEVSLTVTTGADNSVEIKTITIYGQPIVTPIVELRQCDDDLDGFSPFNLNEVISEITSNSINETITFYESEIDAQNSNNAISNTTDYINETISSDKIWARVENYNGCFQTSQINLEISTTQIPNTYLRNFYQCDDGEDTADGIATFDFSSVLSEIQGLFPVGQQLVINFYHNASEALSEINPISDISNYQNIDSPNTQAIYIRVDSDLNNDCLGLGHYITLHVETIPQISVMADEVSICAEGSVDLIADSGYDYYNWSTGESTRIITVDEPGQYTITVSNEYNGLVCSTDKTITVSESNIAIISEIETLDWTQNNNTISVFVEGSGDYEYSIDGFNYQDSNVFSGLNIDEYTIYVRDKNGCGIVSENVYLIYYPRYFTPNGDGNNETWQIINAIKEPTNRLYIYNRYGKLITQLKANDFGWDGTYNGNKMPSSDYWFVLERQNGKTYTGHFTLKR